MQAAKRERERERRREDKQRVVTVMVPIPSDSHLLPCLSKRGGGGKKRQINIVIRSFRLNTTHFYCLCVFRWCLYFFCIFRAIQSASTVTNASQSIVGEISKLTTRVSRLVFFFFFVFLPHPNINTATSPPMPPPAPTPKWTASEAMEQST